MNLGQERRRFPRLQGRFQVDLLNMGDDPTISPWEAVVAAEALDISKQGLRIEASYDVPVGALLSAVVYFQGRESLCLCEVMWKNEFSGKATYGLHFKNWSKLAPTLEKALTRLEKEDEVQEENAQASFIASLPQAA